MKTRSLLTIAGLTFLCVSLSALVPPVIGAADLKAATVNLKDVYTNSVYVKAAGQKFDKMRIDASARIRGISEEIKGIRTKLATGKDSLKKEEVENLQKQLQATSEKLSNEREAFRVKMGFQTKSLRNSFRIQIRQIINAKAKEKGVNLVLHGESVLYSEGMPDLTQEVTKALDASQTSAGPKKPPPAPKK